MLDFDLRFSFKYFLKIAFVGAISPKLMALTGMNGLTLMLYYRLLILPIQNDAKNLRND